MDVTEIRTPQPAFALTTPEGWEIDQQSLGDLVALAPGADAPEVFVRYTVNRPDNVLQNFFQIAVEADAIPSPMEVLTDFAATSEETGLIILAEPVEITHLGFDGAEISFQAPGSNGTQTIDLRLLDTGEDAYIIALAVYFSDAAVETYSADVAEIFESTVYAAPDASIFGE